MSKLEKIFLIYHDDDNAAIVHEKMGWVSTFQHFLKVIVDQIAGWKLNFERVENLNAIKKLPDKYLFIIISSKSLIEDKASLQLLEKIKKKIDEGRVSEDKLLKIQKQYFPKDKEPEFLHHFKDYAFYKANGLSGNRSEYKDFFSNSEEKTFWVKLTDLAYDVLAFSEKRSSGHLDISDYSVFLAETNTVSEKFRNNLKRDLQSIGLNIWPKSSFSDNAGDFIVKLDENIKSSDFSVHIIGNGFGNYINGANHNKEEIQAKITENFVNVYKKENHGAQYKRFFWFDKVGLLSNEKINNFYKELSLKVEDMVGTELVVSSWEEFKSLIFQYISFELPNQRAKASTQESRHRIVYFLYAREDEKKASQYIAALRKKNYKVITSNFDVDIMAVRHIHMESLKRFDYAIIFAEKSGIQWVNMKILDVFKAPGFGREKPVLKKLLIIPQHLMKDLNPASKMFQIMTYENAPEPEILRECLRTLSE